MVSRNQREDRTGISSRVVDSSLTLRRMICLVSTKDTTITMPHLHRLFLPFRASNHPLSRHLESSFSLCWRQLGPRRDHEHRSLQSCRSDCWVNNRTSVRTRTSTILTILPTTDPSMLSSCIACRFTPRRLNVSVRSMFLLLVRSSHVLGVFVCCCKHTDTRTCRCQYRE